MSAYEFEKTSIDGLFKITPFIAPDDRGYLSKPFEKSIFASHGIHMEVWEELYSCSKRGVLRGMHFQRRYSQDKLVRVLYGAVYDVAVDLRKDSKTFGKWESFLLTAENRKMAYIPKGFAHGFLALEENTLFSYICGDRYDPETEGGICWNDPQLAIEWPLEKIEKVTLSVKDAAHPTLEEFLKTHGPLETSL